MSDDTKEYTYSSGRLGPRKPPLDSTPPDQAEADGADWEETLEEQRREMFGPSPLAVALPLFEQLKRFTDATLAAARLAAPEPPDCATDEPTIVEGVYMSDAKTELPTPDRRGTEGQGN